MALLEADVSAMVFCHGCGCEIHSTALTCPKCGTPQQLQSERLNYSFAGSIALCLHRFVQFSGRSPRAEYWYFVLFTALIAVAAVLVDAAFLNGSRLFSTVVNLAVFLPALSVFVRRLHDLDRSGWWYWLILVPVVGAVILFIWLISRGTRGANRFGPEPLAA
jgi:uncharacterized membrane protein YhaH (DUF805 family)